jgi:hypothetical protein
VAFEPVTAANPAPVPIGVEAKSEFPRPGFAGLGAIRARQMIVVPAGSVEAMLKLKVIE